MTFWFGAVVLAIEKPPVGNREIERLVGNWGGGTKGNDRALTASTVHNMCYRTLQRSRVPVFNRSHLRGRHQTIGGPSVTMSSISALVHHGQRMLACRKRHAKN